MVLILWILTGFVCWYLSIYAFRFLVAPMVPAVIGFLKTTGACEPILITSETLLSHMSEYILCLACAMALGYASKPSGWRIIGFVFAANGVSLYYTVLQLSGYTRLYSQLPTSATTMMWQGLVSILVISPFFTIAGAFAGSAFKKSRAVLPIAGASFPKG